MFRFIQDLKYFGGSNFYMVEKEKDNITASVQAGYAFGYETLELTQDETMSRIESFGTSMWIFADGVFVTPEQLAQADWNSVGMVVICPALTALRPPC